MRPTSRDTRPVNLDLGTIDLPVTAYASITHRVTGVLMFFSSFLMLWALDQSLASEASFNAVAAVLSSPLAKLISWGIASVLTYHALAGIKHLIMDAGIGETMRGGVVGARIVFLLAAAAAADEYSSIDNRSGNSTRVMILCATAPSNMKRLR